jgi:hypothetical protein
MFFTVCAKKWKVILGRIQNKMKIIHVSHSVLLMDKKTLQRCVVVLYHHMKPSITVKPIHGAY